MRRPTRNNRPGKSAKKRTVKPSPQKKRTTFAGKFEYGQCEPRILLSANQPPTLDGNSFELVGGKDHPVVSHMVTADFNNDGMDDTAASHYNSDAGVYITFGSADHSGETTFYELGAASRYLRAADMDGDGDQDLVVSNYPESGGPNLYVLTNDGAGNFTVGGVNVSGNSPSGLALGDFDNDGDMDAAFGMHHSSVWRVLTNDGSGNLSVTASYGLSAVEGIETGDFNGDGWIDVVATNLNANRAVFYFNDGTGSFVQNQDISTGGEYPPFMRAGDFDGDGDLDVVVTHQTSNDLTLLENDGTGTFSFGQSYPLGDSVVGQFTAADWNGDGVLDMVATGNEDNGTSKLFVISPVTSQVVEYEIPASDFTSGDQVYSRAVTVGDYDGNGRLEVAISGGYDSEQVLNFYESALLDLVIPEDSPEQTVQLTGITDGDDGTQPLRVTALSDNPTLIPDPAVDYNSPDSTGTVRFTPLPDQFGTAVITVTVEDGGDDNDLNTSGDNLTFSRTFTVTVTPVNDIPLLDPIDDVSVNKNDPEQSVDLAGIEAGGGESQNMRVTAASDNTTLIPTPSIDYSSPNSTGTLRFTPEPGQFGMAIVTVTVEDGGDDNDLNTTGDNLTFSRTFEVTVFATNEPPTLDGNHFELVGSRAHPVAYYMISADFNNDGMDDTAASYYFSPNAGVHITLGSADHSGQTTFYKLGALTQKLRAADIDGDGDQDLVVSNYSDNGGPNLYVLTNDGAGNFSVGGINVSGVSPAGLALGDFDNDGDMDAAFGMHHSSVWRVLTNDGAGNLSVTASYGLATVDAVETGDFNGDGWVDVVGTNLNGNRSVFFFNDGTGNFVEQQNVSTGGEYPSFMRSGDFDGDGDLDVVVAHQTSHNLVMLDNDGTGTFSVGQSYPLGDVSQFSAVDWNRDGVMDMVATGNQDGNSTIHVFSPSTSETETFEMPASDFTSASELYTHAVAVGDYDGDGRLEVAVSGGNGDDQKLNFYEAGLADMVIPEDSPEQLVTLTGISDGDGGTQPLSVTATSDNPGLIGNLVVDYSAPETTGALRFAPIADQYGVAIITITVEDGGDDDDLSTKGDNLSISRSFTVTVQPLNDAPLLDPIEDLTIDEDGGQQSVALTGIDAGGGETQNLRVTATSDNTALTGTPTVDYGSPNSTGNIRFTPLPNQFGTATLTVTVEDGGDDNDLNTSGDNLTFNRTFQVTVDPVNDPPSVDPIEDLAVPENAMEQTIDLTGIDAGGGESQNLRVTASSDNTGLIPTPTVDYNTPESTGSLRFTPLTDQNGSASITVTVEDGGDDNDLNTPGDNLSYSQTFTVTVDSVNQPPTLDPISDLVMDEDSPQQIVNLTGISAGVGETQDLRVTASSDNTALIPTPTVDYNTPNTTGSIRFTPALNQYGTTMLTVTVEDAGMDGDLNTPGDNLKYSHTFQVTVTPVNDTPRVNPLSDVVIDEDSPQQVVSLSGINAGGGESQNLRVTTSSNNTALIPTPTVEYSSPDSTGSIRFTPALNQYGTAMLTVTVEDAGLDGDLNTPGDNLTYSQSFMVNVNPVNDAPTVNPISDLVIDEDSPQQVVNLSGINAGGGESQNLRVTASSNNTALIPTPQIFYNSPESTAVLRFTPMADQFGAVTITVQVEDAGQDGNLNSPGDNLTFSRSFLVTVNPVNDTPLIDPIDDVTIDEDGFERSVNLTGIDAGGGESQNLRITASSNNTSLIPTPAVDYSSANTTGIVRFTPLPNQFGTAVLTVTIEDGGDDNNLNTSGDNLTFSRTFTVIVNPVNDTPSVDPVDDMTIDEDANQQSIGLTGIDAGGGESQNLRVTASSNNTALIPTPTVYYSSPNSIGTVRFTPLPDQFGTAIITVTVEDGGDDNNLDTSSDNLTFSRTFKVTVTEVEDLGPVDFFMAQSLVVDSQRWYEGTTSQSGMLTVQTEFNADSSNGDLDLQLLDGQKQWIASGSPVAGGLRLDYLAASGEKFYLKIVGDNSDVDLRVLNLVEAVGDTVTVAGTDLTDDYSLTAGANHRLVVHGIDYTFSGDDYSQFDFDGGDGSDSIWIGGTSGAESAILRLDDTQITGAGYTVEALNISDVAFTGRGGADTATFYDTNTADTFISSPIWAKMVGASYSHIVRGLPTVTAHAALGYDLAYMNDSAGNDTYETFSERVVMTSDTHVATAIGFKRSSGTSSGGNDTATAHDSAGNDRLLSYEDRIILYDGTHTHTSIDFGTNQVFASGQAGDVAYMFDSAGDDQMVARPESTVITQSDRETTAQGFAQSFAYASTGNDTAEFHDTAGNNDYNGYLDRAVMKGDGIFLWGRGFDQMAGYFSSGNDRALMFDSEGDDTYVSGASDTTMSNELASNRIVGYTSIYAYSHSGTDTATIHDTAGKETFRAYPDKSVLHGVDMFSWTRGFSQVTAHSSGGTDEAQFFDSAGDDTFRSEGTTSQLSGDGYLNLAQGFLKNSGYSSGGSDTALMFDTSGDDQYRAYSGRAVMIGSGVTNTAYNFGNTQGFSNTGTDSARLFDSAGDDLLMSYADRATLSGDGWANEVVGFYLNTVYGSGGYDQATMEDSTGNDTVKVRTIGPKMTQGDGTVFDVRTFDRILARSVNGGEDIAELLDVDYEFELEGDWNS